jgi:hypothetical protein
MPTQKASGTQTATINTEHTLATITDAGTYMLAVDLNNLINDEVVELRAKVKVLSGGTTRNYLLAIYAHVQSDPVVMSIPIPVLHEVVFTLKQTAVATGRDFPWEVIQVDG